MAKMMRVRSRASADAASAAASLIRSRQKALLRAVSMLSRNPSGRKSSKAVHEVRVATRRMAAAIDAFGTLVGEKDANRARRVIRSMRRACATTRDADVMLSWAITARKQPNPPPEAGLEYLERCMRRTRRASKASLLKDLPKLEHKLRKRLTRAAERPAKRAESRVSFGDVARAALEANSDGVLEAAAADLTDVECLHRLRIACKRLRYGIELFQQVLPKAHSKELLEPLEVFQEQLGEFTDASMRASAIEAIRDQGKAERSAASGAVPKAMTALGAMLRSERTALRRGQKKAIRAWEEIEKGGLIDSLRRIVLGLSGRSPTAPAVQGKPEAASLVESKAESEGTSRRTERGAVAAARQVVRKGKRRLAAVDIGTNSIRLIVAEAAQDGTYKVLDDEKEITRLGRGLHESGRLDPATQEHSAVTIARMKSIAEGYGAEQLRVVATAACREARNSHQFVELVRERAGVEVEIISPEEEALLAYRSAAGAFDFTGVPASVIDLGGGSLEVVLSAGSAAGDVRRAGLGGGVIERVHSLPLGAVRLTEQFGGPERSAGKRFRELARFVKETLRKEIGKPPLVPQIVVGTGGTFTALATLLAHKELGPGASGLFSGAVQGREIRRADVRHVVEYLRDMSVKERAKVPGLPADRADIIVSGLAVIDETLGFLHANSVFVHEGGIRDGLLLSMVRASVGPVSQREVSPMRGVKRFAKACNYEAAHACHVTRLALRIFDQLAPRHASLRLAKPDAGMGFTSRDRLLLEAAALLHDVGYLINYASHHKHSYHLIVHAELPGFTSREVQVIANVARYHRASEPKVGHHDYATLSEEDQSRVRALAAVLRIADGLDRTHMQQVEDVAMVIENGSAAATILAATEPAVDIWGAARKSRLFTRTFGLPLSFEWRKSAAADSPVVAEISPV